MNADKIREILEVTFQTFYSYEPNVEISTPVNRDVTIFRVWPNRKLLPGIWGDITITGSMQRKANDSLGMKRLIQSEVDRLFVEFRRLKVLRESKKS